MYATVAEQHYVCISDQSLHRNLVNFSSMMLVVAVASVAFVEVPESLAK